VNIFENTTNHTMKTEDQAWQALRDHAAKQLPGSFADRVLRAAQGPQPETWRQLQMQAAAQLRPGFAERVLRAAREFPASMPSLFNQFALGTVTVAVCLVAVVALHTRSSRLDEQVALAGWKQLAMEAQEIDAGL
jgi:hypothetical protein